MGDKVKQSQGTGLGLAISDQIVNLMDSKIRVKSQLGVGSTFSFKATFPLSYEWVQSATNLSGKQIVGYTGKQKSILVIDERWENRSLLISLLQPMGFMIVEAENAAEGLAQIKQMKPDLIITDLHMPVMDGFEMLRCLRTSEELKKLLVIVSSASVLDINYQYSLNIGGDDFLPQPVNSQELLKILEKHLQIEWKYAQTEAIEKTGITDNSSIAELIFDN